MSFSRALQKSELARLAAAILMVLGLGFAVAACGSSDSDSDSGSGTEGGEITISQTSQPDFLDPALSYTVNGWEPMWLVYTPLLTYPHVEGTAGGELIPGLAEALPTVSNGGKTYKLKLREGLKYSDGQPVVASDFAHTIKRVLNLESGGSFFYENIVGADEYLKNGDPQGEIAGIKTNDNTGEITVDLVSAGRVVLEHPGDELRRARPRRHSVQEHDRQPARWRGVVHDHRVGSEPRSS